MRKELPWMPVNPSKGNCLCHITHHLFPSHPDLPPVTYRISRCWLQLCNDEGRRCWYFSQSPLRNVLTIKDLNPLVLCSVWWHQKGNYTLTDVMLYFFVSGSLPSQLSCFWGYSVNSVYHLSPKLLLYFYYLNIILISIGFFLWRQESNKCPD